MTAERPRRLEALRTTPAVRASARRNGGVVWVGVIALLAVPAFLGWAAAGPRALRERAAHAATAARELIAAARGSASQLTGAAEGDSLLASRRAAHRSGPVVVRRQWPGRAAGPNVRVDAALRASRAERLGEVAHTARSHVRRRAQRHLPSGEPSPYDATAPPSAIRRDG